MRLIRCDNGEAYAAPAEFQIDRIDRLIAALGRTPTTSFDPLRCEAAYGHSLDEGTVRCPNLATQVVRVFKNSDDLALMCNDCAGACWSFGD